MSHDEPAAACNFIHSGNMAYRAAVGNYEAAGGKSYTLAIS